MSTIPNLCLVGYTFRNYPAAFAFEQAKRSGYASVELRDFCDFDWSSPTALNQTLPAVASLAWDHGLETWGMFHAIDVPTPGCRGLLADYVDLLAVLRYLDIRIWHAQVRMPGISSSRGATSEHYHAAGTFLTLLGDAAERMGVTIAIESHMGTLHDTADAQWRLLESCMTDHVTASLDFANLLIENPQEDLTVIIHRFSGRIGYVHMKNVRLRSSAWDWDISLREGDIDYKRLLPILLETYQGPLGVEYCGSGDPVMVIEDDATYLQDIASP